jgi:predicted alpha/beta hydrolase
VVPGLTHSFGYLPLSWLTRGQDVPAGMALQWAEWGRDPRYLLKSPLAEDGHALAGLAIPLRSYAFTDDEEFAPVAAVDALLAWYSAARVERKVVAPGDLGRARIGHFGWLKDDFRDSLWTEMADWLRTTVE